jgi:hypothetical protein
VFDAVERASFAQTFDPEGEHAAGAYNPGIIFNRASNWPMMSDPRFVRLCHKLRYVDLWLETGRWPDCADQVPYDFKGEARRLASANVWRLISETQECCRSSGRTLSSSLFVVCRNLSRIQFPQNGVAGFSGGVTRDAVVRG